MPQPNKEYAYKILRLLKQHYPHAKMILKWSSNFELLVAIILSAQCTDVMVNKVTASLFPKYCKRDPKLRRYYESHRQIISLPENELIEIINFEKAPISKLEQDVKSTGFYHNKAKNIQKAAKTVLERYKGTLPKTIDELTKIPGVGRKTANVFLGNAYHISEGIAVDTHVKKQARLLGLTKETNSDKIEQDLMKLFDQKDWFTLTYLLIAHGRNMRKKISERKVCGRKDCVLCNRLLTFLQGE